MFWWSDSAKAMMLKRAEPPLPHGSQPWLLHRINWAVFKNPYDQALALTNYIRGSADAALVSVSELKPRLRTIFLRCLEIYKESLWWPNNWGRDITGISLGSDMG